MFLAIKPFGLDPHQSARQVLMIAMQLQINRGYKMPDLTHYAQLISARIKELDTRIHEVDHDLSEPKPRDMNDQSIDIEDDEVLEGIGIAAQKEIGLLNLALARIKDGSYGICKKCEEPISEARLNAVLYAPLCKSCAAGN
jgi:RNA polymerase-binding transcription factor DksA